MQISMTRNLKRKQLGTTNITNNILKTIKEIIHYDTHKRKLTLSYSNQQTSWNTKDAAQ
jgi:hypothetical protein